MKKGIASVVMTGVIACFTLGTAVSCVNEEYTVEEDSLDSSVQVFKDGVQLPVGSIDTLRVKDIKKLAGESLDAFISVMEGGDYSFGLMDTLIISDTLNKMLEKFKIDAFKYNDPIEIDLQSIDVSKIKVDAMTLPEEGPYKVSIADIVQKPNLPVIDAVGVHESIEAGVSKYVPDMGKLQLPVKDITEDVKLVELPEGENIPSYALSDTPFKLDERALSMLGMVMNSSFEAVETVPLNLELPEGITSVNDIILHENAALEISIEMVDPILSSGKIVPDIDIDLHNLLHLKDISAHDHAVLERDFTLSANEDPSKHYKAVKRYSISSLAIEKDDWTVENGKAVLKQEKRMIEIPVQGSIKMEDCYTTTNLIQKQRHIEFLMSIRFVDFSIADVEMSVEPIVVEHSENVAVAFDPVKLPAEIKSLDNVSFDESSIIEMTLSPKNIEKLVDLDIMLEQFEIEFPQGLVVKDLATGDIPSDNTIEVAGEDLKDGFSKRIQILEFNLPEPDADRYISYNEKIKVYTKVSAGGDVRSSQLPVRSQDDIRFDIDVNGKLTIDDYKARIADYVYDFSGDFQKQSIKVSLPDEIADLKGPIVVYPEGRPVVTLDLHLPELPQDTDIRILADNIRIDFPEMIRFRNVPSEYSYDEDNGIITLDGEIPSELNLEVDRLIVTPYYDETDKKYYALGDIEITGGIVVTESDVTMADVDKLTSPESEVRISASIPEMKPSNVDIDTYTTSIEHTVEIEFDLDDIEEMDMIKEIDFVNLKDVFITLDIDAQKLMSEIKADMDFNVVIDLPEFIVIEDSRVKDGKLEISDRLVDGKISIDPIPVKALKDLNLKEGLNQNIDIKGSLVVSNANIGVSALDKKHLINIDMAIKSDIPGSEDEVILIKDVSGKIDFQLDPISDSIDLSDMTSLFEEGGNFSADLDLNRFHLALDLKSNLVVPVNMKLDLIPYYDGVAKPDAIDPLELNLTSAESVDKVSNTRFWISNTQDGMPSGYQYIKFDILSLLRTMPEKLEFSFSGGTDPSKSCLVALDRALVLEANYELAVPMEFGDDFEITYRDTISLSPKLLNHVLNSSDIAVKGEVTSRLPLQVTMSVNLLDSEQNLIRLDPASGKQVIPSSVQGEAATTDLNILLKKEPGTDVTDLKYLEVAVTLDSGNAAGISLNENDYLTATIKIELPSGIAIDIEEFMPSEE
ncbi:MAG: hypothetical protein J6A22_01800 [Bacteroidales bacterium]|nr:hypothetical protein [Bacteroidales bacterium]